MLVEPEPAYHGVQYTKAFGPAAFIARARTVPLRNTGSAISPLNAFLILQGIQTLPVRMDRHVSNAKAVAQHLKDHPQVEWVHYAGLPDSPVLRAGAEVHRRQAHPACSASGSGAATRPGSASMMRSRSSSAW